MNLQDQDSIEAFRQRLEKRFHRDRILKRCKLVAGVVLASVMAMTVPLAVRSVVNDTSIPPLEGPGKWYLSFPGQSSDSD